MNHLLHYLDLSSMVKFWLNNMTYNKDKSHENYASSTNDDAKKPCRYPSRISQLEVRICREHEIVWSQSQISSARVIDILS